MPLRPRVLVTLLLLALLLVVLATRRADGQNEQTSLKLNMLLINQYLDVLPSTGLINDDYTIEAWVRPTSYVGNPTIVGNDYQLSVWVGLNATGHVRFYPVGSVFVESGGIVPLNQWTHVAVTYEAANGWAIYLNGQLDSQSGSITGPVGSGPPDLRIGADRSAVGPSFFWRGWLDEVRIWTAARTGSQIRQTMYAGAGRPGVVDTGVYAELEGWWDMQDPSAAGVFDRGFGNGHADHFADFVNVTDVDVQAPPVAYNVALQLNGDDDFAYLPMDPGFQSGLTIEAWIAPISYAGFPTVVGRDFFESFWLGLSEIGRLRFYPTGGLGNYVDGLTTIPLDTWTHVAATYRAGVTRLYVNGRLDLETTAITGPIGENFHNIYVGADDPVGGAVLHFHGLLDEVRVTRGALSAATIRAEMFRGYAGTVGTAIQDELGVFRERRQASFEGIGPTPVFGTSARMVRSGAPIAGSNSAVFNAPLATFTSRILGGATSFLPDLYLALNLADEVYYPTPLAITDLDAFVVAGTQQLDAVRVRLRSPEGTWIDLVTPGQANGRDLHTVFDDQAPLTLAAAVSPYVDGVRPSQSFSAFDGENAAGLWRLELVDESPSPLGVELWAWGLRVEGGVLDATTGAARVVALRNAGANPVRGAGRLSFDLAREADVRLGLYDVQGREVRTLVAERRGAGQHQLGWNAAGLESGLYFARLRVDGVEVAPIRITVLQ